MFKLIQELLGFAKSPFMRDLLAFGALLVFDVAIAELKHGEDDAANEAKHAHVRQELDKLLDEKGGLEWPSFLQDPKIQDMILDKLIALIVQLVKRGK